MQDEAGRGAGPGHVARGQREEAGASVPRMVGTFTWPRHVVGGILCVYLVDFGDASKEDVIGS